MLDKHICYAVKSLASLQQELLSHIVLCNMTKLHDDSGEFMFSFLPIAARDHPDINLSGVDSTPLGIGK